MKKILFAIAVMLIGYAATAQDIISITPDTLTKVETEYFSTVRLTDTYSTFTMNALMTELGGTSDGTAIFQGSLDGTSWNTLTSTTGKYYFYPNDTLTITSGATWTVIVEDPALQYYRIAAIGTVSDTTLVTPKYSMKKSQ